jgi:hypothetical protein
MNKPITEQDFTAMVDLYGLHPDSRYKVSKDSFELAKRMALSFTVWCFENKHYPIGNDIWTNYNTNPPRLIDGQQLFELYQQQKQ